MEYHELRPPATLGTNSKTNAQCLFGADEALKISYSDVEKFVLGIGDDVVKREL